MVTPAPAITTKKGRFCPYREEPLFCQEGDCSGCEINLDALEDCIPWDKPERKTCYFCGHTGRDVNHFTHIYIGGKGDAQYPICDDKEACIKRVESK